MTSDTRTVIGGWSVRPSGWHGEVELWTTAQAARHCGVTPGTWRHNVSTGVPAHLRAPAAVGRQAGSAGESLFPADAVRAWHAGRPGRGARTDLVPSARERAQ